MKKRFRREDLICRADGDSRIYEVSHKERLKVLQENHEQHFSCMSIGFLAPREDEHKHVVSIFGKQMVLNDEEYKRYQNAFKK